MLKRFLPLFILLALLVPVLLYLLPQTRPSAGGEADAVDDSAPPSGTVVVEPELRRSILAEAPDWGELDDYQEVMSEREFVELMDRVFAPGEAWRAWIEVAQGEARIRTSGEAVYLLRFAADGYELPTRRNWLRTAELPEAPVGRPLHGLHIAIDPGHLGGQWAQLEERWLVVDGQPPICEGDMTLEVAKQLKPRLEGLGATVTLVRDGSQPVTPTRPEDHLDLARHTLGPAADEAAVRKLAERIFYRTAEIRARADLINHGIRPDLVVCLHFNADAWGDPRKPTLVDRHHFHVLVHGAYGPGELAMEDQRFILLKKLLGRVHREEAEVAKSVSDVFLEFTEMPPFTYPPNAPNARNVDDHPCVWARNLLANRLFACPVVFLEPYVMNSKIDYPRMQAGDYPGLRVVAGKPQLSIFREYTELVIAGLVRHYGERRVNCR